MACCVMRYTAWCKCIVDVHQLWLYIYVLCWHNDGVKGSSPLNHNVNNPWYFTNLMTKLSWRNGYPCWCGFIFFFCDLKKVHGTFWIHPPKQKFLAVLLCYWQRITQTRWHSWYQLIINQRSVSRHDYTRCKISTATVHNLLYTTSLLQCQSEIAATNHIVNISKGYNWTTCCYIYRVQRQTQHQRELLYSFTRLFWGCRKAIEVWQSKGSDG